VPQVLAPGRSWTRPPALAEHERLARLLTPADRELLARAAEVLPGGWVVLGMAVPERGAVVDDTRYPLGVRVVVAPAGPAGAARALPPELLVTDPGILVDRLR